jgi:hypothetical protein
LLQRRLRSSSGLATAFALAEQRSDDDGNADDYEQGNHVGLPLLGLRLVRNLSVFNYPPAGFVPKGFLND